MGGVYVKAIAKSHVKSIFAKVEPVDVWAHYAYLKDVEGWTQEKIAEAKGVSQTTISQRLKLNNLPDKIKDFIRQDTLKEDHLKEITRLLVTNSLSPWLTNEQAWFELDPGAGDQDPIKASTG